MGYPSKRTAAQVMLRNGQGNLFGTSNISRITIGGYERLTYKEVVNGVTIIRTKWRKRKTRIKHKK